MATSSKAKKFEQQLRQDWYTYLPDSFCYRLFDVMSGYSGIRSVSDFICYSYPFIFLIDAKTHAGNIINFHDFSQYDSMLEYKNVKGLQAGTVIWFYEQAEPTVVWVPIQTWEKIKLEGKKSFNVKMINDPEYECLLLPSKKKRVFCETNYQALVDYYKDKYGNK